MEEEKVSLPKPPKALRQTKEQKPPEVKEQIVLPQKQEIPEQVQGQPVEKKKRERKKINFSPIINWVGLGCSVAILGLFIFLLCK